jgi:hypothetical protein
MSDFFLVLVLVMKPGVPKIQLTSAGGGRANVLILDNALEKR